MVRLLGIGIVAQILMSAVLGVRLLWLARRTREVPELAFGISFLCLGAFGYPLSIAARGGAGGPEVAGTLLLVALTAQDVAALAIAVGTWRTFHPEQRWMAGVVLAVGLAFVASLVGQGRTVGYLGGTDGGAWYYLGFGLRFAAHVWSCGVAFRYTVQLKRRLALGLADPVVADRITKWAWTSLFISVGFAIFLAARLAGANPGKSMPVLVSTSLISVASVITMWLAFFPPRAYLERVAARSASHDEAR